MSGLDGAPRHWTAWEDEQVAGVRCSEAPGQDWNTVAVGEPEVCKWCGYTLRLVWNVSVETTPPALVQESPE